MSEKSIALSISNKMFLKIVSKPMPLRHSLTFPYICVCVYIYIYIYIKKIQKVSYYFKKCQKYP